MVPFFDICADTSSGNESIYRYMRLWENDLG